ncbi:hypothetical protein [Streptomyces sp. NRRL F-4428]|uniref:hypothetical protein n=1 Tax=Streptomyces sp. NRRL F-4428 TaxID=1609137 RepID=UPI000A894E70|nr:hypothetical protein [Streptomyces sp. NRRL F-4428]
MNDIIPPSGEWERRRLERKADALLEADGDEMWDNWPASWPRREEMEFDRIAAAHTGMVPLVVVPLVASLPSFDPEGKLKHLSALISEVPTQETEHIETALAEVGGFHKCGKEQAKREVWECCRWMGCREPLYTPGKPRRQGNPRKYCPAHQKPARARTERLRAHGIWVGKHRNLAYIEDHPAPIAEWVRPVLEDCYQASRDCWLPLNVPGWT